MAKKKWIPVQGPLMDIFSENLNKEFTGEGLVAQLGCADNSISLALRRLHGNGWDIVRVGRGRYICRGIGDYSMTNPPESLPFMTKKAALRTEQPEVLVPEVTAPPVVSTPATPSGMNVGDLLEVSHVTRQGVVIAMDVIGNAYKVSPL
jgi:hypothetical protein